MGPINKCCASLASGIANVFCCGKRKGISKKDLDISSAAASVLQESPSEVTLRRRALSPQEAQDRKEVTAALADQALGGNITPPDSPSMQQTRAAAAATESSFSEDPTADAEPTVADTVLQEQGNPIGEGDEGEGDVVGEGDEGDADVADGNTSKEASAGDATPAALTADDTSAISDAVATAVADAAEEAKTTEETTDARDTSAAATSADTATDETEAAEGEGDVGGEGNVAQDVDVDSVDAQAAEEASKDTTAPVDDEGVAESKRLQNGVVT